MLLQISSDELTFWNVICRFMAILLRTPCVNTLWPSGAVWWHTSDSTVSQVMAWCLLAPSHYLNQSWLVISESQWHQSEHISQEIPQALITLISFKIHCKISFKSPRGQWVNICVKLYLCYTYRQIYTYIDSLSPYLNKVRWQWVNICRAVPAL